MATRNNEAKSYLGAPEPYDTVTDDWTAYMQRFKHFFLANGVTEDRLKLYLFQAQTLFSYCQISPRHKNLENLVTLR